MRAPRNPFSHDRWPSALHRNRMSQLDSRGEVARKRVSSTLSKAQLLGFMQFDLKRILCHNMGDLEV